ncbi:hypothetical protein GWO13_01595 [Candidatus Bathyarchaeota archaeon]|nr:hypothetical protein [Candidatus Bathyarchaeota archaeon]
MVAEVIEVTERLHTVEKTSIKSSTKHKGKIGKKKLDDLLLGVVDETMRQVFREKGAEVISGYIGNECHLKGEEIAGKPEVFSAGLERLLGSGASVIENLILKNLYRKLKLKFEDKKGYEFSDYINELKEKLD